MSLLFKEAFNQYPIGHNLIGAGNMDWTVRHNSAAGNISFDVTSEKWGFLRADNNSWHSVSSNHPNITNMTDGKIVSHRKTGDRFLMLFRYSATGGYYFTWKTGPPSMRIYRFSSWNFQAGTVLVANYSAFSPATLYEVEIDLNGNGITTTVNNILIGTVNNSAHASGTVGLGTYYLGSKFDDLYIFNNNSMTPLAPTNLTLTVLNANSIKLNFDNLAFNADYICIERKTGISGTFLEIDRAPGNAQSYIDRYCQPGNDYYYQVRAVRL